MQRPLGKIFNQGSDQYLLVYSNLNTAYKIYWIEEVPVKGNRIVAIIYRYYVESQSYIGDRLFTDVRYGLIDSNNNLITQCDFFSMTRQKDGKINAIYPDPQYDGNRACKPNEERFNCTLDLSGSPLFECTCRDADGKKYIKYKKISNEIVAVSKCYYGITLFVKNHKIGIVNYDDIIELEAEYFHIDIQKYNNCIVTYRKPIRSFVHPEEHNESDVYILSKNKSHWSVILTKLSPNFHIEKYYESDDLYLLKNGKTSQFCICYKRILGKLGYSHEYSRVDIIDTRRLPNHNGNSFFIVTDEKKKKGVIGICGATNDLLKTMILEEQQVFPFEYDSICQIDGLFLSVVRNNLRGIISLESMSIVVDCVIPENDKILPDTIGEGFVGCRRKIKENFTNNDYFYYYSDLKGHEALGLDIKWKIRSGFNNGVAMIESKDEYAFVDVKGNITVSKGKNKSDTENDHNDVYNCYEDTSDRDNWDAMTDGMYGDYPDEGYDGDYEFMGR